MVRVVVFACAAACGRIGFDGLAPPPGDGAPTVDASRDAPAQPIAYVGPFAQRHPGPAVADSFTISAHAAGDLIVLQVSCGGGNLPSSVSLGAPGWTFVPLGQLGANAASQLYSANFLAIAPNTAAVTMSVAWTGATCTVGLAELGDEFTEVDPAMPVVRTRIAIGTGDCLDTIPTDYDNQAIWAACFSESSLVATGAGYTKGADDGGGDWAEYKITTDPAGTNENVSFTNTAVGYTLSTFAIKPR